MTDRRRVFSEFERGTDARRVIQRRARAADDGTANARDMLGAVRAFFAPKRRRADAQHVEEQECEDAAKRRRAESGARRADSTTAHAESGAFDGAHAEGDDECDV